MEVGVVEETHGGEEVLALAFVRTALLGEVAGDGPDFDPGAGRVDFLGAEEGPFAVARKDVIGGDGHLQGLVAIIERATGFGVAIVVVLFDFESSGAGIETVEP